MHQAIFYNSNQEKLDDVDFTPENHPAHAQFSDRDCCSDSGTDTDCEEEGEEEEEEEEGGGWQGVEAEHVHISHVVQVGKGRLLWVSSSS